MTEKSAFTSDAFLPNRGSKKRRGYMLKGSEAKNGSVAPEEKEITPRCKRRQTAGSSFSLLTSSMHKMILEVEYVDLSNNKNFH